MIAAAAAGPSPLWYATRGSGFTALVLLTVSVVLGLITSVRWYSDSWPRFLSQALHRNVSLFALVFLVIHIATAILDPFADITVRDAVVPVGASYRPLWLGLGVIAAELFAAVLLTSLLRRAMSFRVWKAVHWLAYASWPVAVLHGIGTGTDTKAGWAILLTVACVGAVVVTLVWRLAAGWPHQALLRSGGIVVSLAAVVALAAWTVSGPMQPGWARLAGTPSNLLATTPSSAASPAPAAVALPAGLNDQLTGRLERSDTATTAVLDDERDTTLQLTIVANQDGTGTLTVTRSGQTVCTAAATIGDQVTARCGTVLVQVQVQEAGRNAIAGTLVTQAAGS